MSSAAFARLQANTNGGSLSTRLQGYAALIVDGGNAFLGNELRNAIEREGGEYV
jgi:hypothetical protein